MIESVNWLAAAPINQGEYARANHQGIKKARRIGRAAFTLFGRITPRLDAGFTFYAGLFSHLESQILAAFGVADAHHTAQCELAGEDAVG